MTGLFGRFRREARLKAAIAGPHTVPNAGPRETIWSA